MIDRRGRLHDRPARVFVPCIERGIRISRLWSHTAGLGRGRGDRQHAAVGAVVCVIRFVPKLVERVVGLVARYGRGACAREVGSGGDVPRGGIARLSSGFRHVAGLRQVTVGVVRVRDGAALG